MCISAKYDFEMLKWLKNLNLQYLGDWELTEYQFRSQLSLGPPAKNSYDIIFNFMRNPIMKEKEQYYYITLSYRINIFFITILYHRCFNALVTHSNLQ